MSQGEEGEGEMSPDSKMRRRQENAPQEPRSASPDPPRVFSHG